MTTVLASDNGAAAAASSVTPIAPSTAAAMSSSYHFKTTPSEHSLASSRPPTGKTIELSYGRVKLSLKLDTEMDPEHVEHAVVVYVVSKEHAETVLNIKC